MKKLFFVINPYAGTRKANKVLADIMAVFNRADYDVHIYVTEKQGDARCVVAQRAEQMDLIVCCGGDGTFNESVAGLLESGVDIPIGYIPAGSTNDFANSLGLPTDPVAAARRIVEGKPELFDVGSFNGRYFTYVASFGVFTKVSYNTPQNVKNALGHTAYVLGSIQELTQLRNKFHVKLLLDGEPVEGDFLFGAVCNSTSVGGVLTLDPKRVDMSDGQFEVLLVRYPKDLVEVADCIQAVQKQTYDCKMLTFRSASRVEVIADANMDWTLDGEKQEGSTNILIENLHHAFRFVR